MEMHEIRYFLALCETLNFNRAAERCCISQPALTRAIHKLEGELGGLLFRREPHSTRLTELGQLMRQQLGQVLQQTESARATARQFLRLEAAPMTLGVMCTIGPLRFIRFLNEFRHRHPGIQLTLIEAVPSRLAELLLEGDLDVALMAQPNGFDPRLEATAIYRERFVVAFPVGHGFSQCERVPIAALQTETYLSCVHCEFRDHIDLACRSRGVAIQSGYRSEREDWIQTMIAAGMGVCFMPEYSATHPGLMTRGTDPEFVREVSLVKPSGRSLSGPAMALVDAVACYGWDAEDESRR
jgi:LysR family hydrogen peroxide-inducible transcriptional activator